MVQVFGAMLFSIVVGFIFFSVALGLRFIRQDSDYALSKKDVCVLSWVDFISHIYLAVYVRKQQQLSSESEQMALLFSSNNSHMGTALPGLDWIRSLAQQWESLIQKGTWVVSRRNYEKWNCELIFASATEIKLEKMWIGPFVTPRIIKDILLPKFTHLQELYLAQNRIESVQMIHRAFMPELKQIWLRDNLITDFASLRKASWPKVEVLCLYGNLSRDCSAVVAANMPKLSTLWLEYQYNEQVQGDDIKWAAKIQTQLLQFLCVGSAKRVQQPFLDRKLKLRFSGNQIKLYRRDD